MQDYKLPYEILGMVGTSLELSKLDEETFGMAHEIYKRCIPTQISEGDSLRFQKIPDRVKRKRKHSYTIKSSEIKQLAHWLYKRCESKKKDEYKAYYSRLCSNESQLNKARGDIQEAINCFKSSRNVPDASRFLEPFWESAAFTACTLFLSSFFPDEVSFLSPELIHCFSLDTHPTSEVPRDELLYEQLQNLCQSTAQRIESERLGKEYPRSKQSISRPKVEQVAYVLRKLTELEDTYYDPDLVIQEEQIDGVGIFKARAADLDNNQFKKIAGPLAMKEQSIIAERRIVDYLNEISISSRLKSPNLIAFHGWTYNLRHTRIVMDLMKTDLENRLSNSGTWSTRRDRPPGSSRLVLAPLQQLLQGLRALHQEGITHRDIKPQNIFLDQRDDIVLGDFGVSRQARNGIRTTLETLTGTPAYIAPEVFEADDQNKAYTPKADVWAMGCVLFRMIFGHPLIRSTDRVPEITKAVDNFRNGTHQDTDARWPTDTESESSHSSESSYSSESSHSSESSYSSESSHSSESSETGDECVKKDLNADQHQFLYKLIHCEESKRMSVPDALSKCHSIWNGY